MSVEVVKILMWICMYWIAGEALLLWVVNKDTATFDKILKDMTPFGVIFLMLLMGLFTIPIWIVTRFKRLFKPVVIDNSGNDIVEQEGKENGE